MIYKYRKTALIEAEQFDGSTEMMGKYNMHCATTGEVDSDGFHLVGHYLPTKEGDMEVKLFAYIATGIDGEHWVIDEDIFERTYERVD